MTEAEGLLRLALAAGFGALIGWEREDRDKPAGVRTFSLVALGSALFSLMGLLAFGMDDAGARIPAQVVTGVGFLGAGTILHHRGNVIGLTTAAGIWGAAAVGGLRLRALGAVGWSDRHHARPAPHPRPHRTVTRSAGTQRRGEWRRSTCRRSRSHRGRRNACLSVRRAAPVAGAGWLPPQPGSAGPSRMRTGRQAP